MAKSVLEDVNQLNILTNNLLDFTSVHAEDTNINVALVNVVELLFQARSEILKKHCNSDILISINEFEKHLPEIHANESLLYTALINLIENGVKFSPDHAIYIKLILSDNQVIITFQNKTEGILKTELESLFQPFIRGANSKNTSGHGVGLSLTRRIVQLHRGSLIVNLGDQGLIVFELK